MRDWAAEEGAAIGAGAAEGFRLIVIDEDDQAPEPGSQAPAAE